MRYIPNSRFDPKKIAGVRAKMREAGDAVGEHAQSVASQVSESYETRTEDNGDTVRVVAETRSLDAAGWIEWGTSTLPAYAPLRKGVEANGLELRGP